MDKLQAKRQHAEEVATYIDTYGGGRAVSNQLSELAAVATTDIEHRPTGNIA